METQIGIKTRQQDIIYFSMSVSQQRAKVLQMQGQRKQMGEKLDWDDQAAVSAFNTFQSSLAAEESKLSALEKEERESKNKSQEWDFDGDYD